MNLKTELILIYTNSVKERFYLTDLVHILSMSFAQVENQIMELVKRGFLEYNEERYLLLTDNGLDYLERNGLAETDIFSIYDERPTLLKSNRPAEVGYIPLDFEKKFKGYNI